MACSALQYYSTLSHKRRDFLNKQLLPIKLRSDFLDNFFSETFFILRRIERVTFKKAHWFSSEVPVSLIVFQRNLNFLDKFAKYTQISNFMKIRPVGAELFHAEGQMDRQT